MSGLFTRKKTPAHTPKQAETEFPLLHAQNIAYLDSGATTQKPESVLAAMDTYYRTANANVHRGVYKLADASTQAYEDARHAVAAYMHKHDDEIVFTSGATHALNLAAHILESALKPGDEILTTIAEHHAVFVPFQQLAKRTGATLIVVPLSDDQSITVEAINAHVNKNTVIIAVSAMSNVLGYALDTDAIRKQSAALVVDAAQSIRHTTKYANADFVAFSAHKLYGPQGVGVLASTRAQLAKGKPFMTGGGMIQHVALSDSTWADAPGRYEAGTPNVAGAVGLAAAIRWYQPQQRTAEAHEHELTRKAVAIISAAGGTILGPVNTRTAPIISFTMPQVHAHDVAQVLDSVGVCVRAGHHCCGPLHETLGIEASVRVSIALYNTEEDIARLQQGLAAVRAHFL